VNYLTRKQATAHIRKKGIPCGIAQVAKLAVEGTGPQFRYAGKYPLYTEQDLDDWIEARLSAPARSTRLRSGASAQPRIDLQELTE
jgi:hypothetical protein